MSITIELPPETEQKLRHRAAASGRDVLAFVVDTLEEKLRSPPESFEEILAPIHEEFRESGMTESELDEFLQQEIEAVRKERRAKQPGA